MIRRFANQQEAASLGKCIIRARDKLGITQTELAEEVGVERSLVSKIESGYAKTYNRSVHKVCTYLKIDSSSLALQLATIQQRLEAISVDFPQVVEAVRLVLDAMETAAIRKPVSRMPKSIR